MKAVPAGDLERDQADLPRAGRDRERALDPAHVQHVDAGRAQRDGPADRDGVNEAAVEVVLPSISTGGSRPGTAQDAMTAGMSGPLLNQRAVALSMLAATQWNGSARSVNSRAGSVSASSLCSGSIARRWVPERSQPDRPARAWSR